MTRIPADLTAEERECLLDMTQLLLDVAGIVEPTPFADSTSALISLYRGEWMMAGISVVAAAVPYAGDAAKALKLPNYERSLAAALRLASQTPRFANALRPVLEQFLNVLRRVPAHRLPPAIQSALARMRNTMIEFLHRSGKAVSRYDHLVDDLLTRLVGTTQNVGILPRQNVQRIVEFFSRHGVDGHNVAKWAEYMKGIDLHAVDAVSVIRFRPGDLVAEYVDTLKPAGRQIGQWMIRAADGVTDRNLGLSKAGRVRKTFRVTKHVEVLQTKAAAAADHWTLSGTKKHFAIVREEVTGAATGQAPPKTKMVRKAAEHVAGGGTQYFLPRAWEVLEEVVP